MTTQERIDELKELIIKATALVEKPLVYGVDFEIIHQPMHHTPVRLKAGYMAVYSFFWGETVLKVGQAGSNNKARFQSQHYQTFRYRANASTLARSIVGDSSMEYLDLNDYTVGDWIKNNCERFDVLLDAKLGKITLNFIEGLLQYKYQPKFEG